MEGILSLRNISIDDMDRVGFKAAMISVLADNFEVADGFVITSDVFESFIAKAGLFEGIRSALLMASMEKDETIQDAANLIQRHILSVQLPKDIASDIIEAYEALSVDDSQSISSLLQRSSPPKVVIRSSPLEPPSSGARFMNLMNISEKDALLRGVLSCYASLFTADAIRNRFSQKIRNTSMAVIVQKMLKLERTGYAYSRSPRPGKFLIKACHGLTNQRFNDRIAFDRYIIASDELDIEKTAVATQTETFVVDVETSDIIKVDISKGRGSVQKLDMREIADVARTVKLLQAKLDFGLEVNFGYVKDTLYLLGITKDDSPADAGRSAKPGSQPASQDPDAGVSDISELSPGVSVYSQDDALDEISDDASDEVSDDSWKASKGGQQTQQVQQRSDALRGQTLDGTRDATGQTALDQPGPYSGQKDNPDDLDIQIFDEEASNLQVDGMQKESVGSSIGGKSSLDEEDMPEGNYGIREDDDDTNEKLGSSQEHLGDSQDDGDSLEDDDGSQEYLGDSQDDEDSLEDDGDSLEDDDLEDDDSLEDDGRSQQKYGGKNPVIEMQEKLGREDSDDSKVDIDIEEDYQSDETDFVDKDSYSDADGAVDADETDDAPYAGDADDAGDPDEAEPDDDVIREGVIGSAGQEGFAADKKSGDEDEVAYGSVDKYADKEVDEDVEDIISDEEIVPYGVGDGDSLMAQRQISQKLEKDMDRRHKPQDADLQTDEEDAGLTQPAQPAEANEADRPMLSESDDAEFREADMEDESSQGKDEETGQKEGGGGIFSIFRWRRESSAKKTADAQKNTAQAEPANLRQAGAQPHGMDRDNIPQPSKDPRKPEDGINDKPILQDDAGSSQPQSAVVTYDEQESPDPADKEPVKDPVRDNAAGSQLSNDDGNPDQDENIKAQPVKNPRKPLANSRMDVSEIAARMGFGRLNPAKNENKGQAELRNQADIKGQTQHGRPSASHEAFSGQRQVISKEKIVRSADLLEKARFEVSKVIVSCDMAIANSIRQRYESILDREPGNLDDMIDELSKEMDVPYVEEIRRIRALRNRFLERSQNLSAEDVMFALKYTEMFLSEF